MMEETRRNPAAKEFDNLKSLLDRLAGAVVAQAKALEAGAASLDAAALTAVVSGDTLIDDLELAVAEKARAFMELRTPLGPDFRFVLSSIEAARNLERIGDCLEYVARYLRDMPTLPKLSPHGYSVLTQMVGKCREILELVYAAWSKSDGRLAARIPDQDDAVDALQDEARELMVREVRAGTLDVELGLKIVLVANKLESIADITSHVAETVVFWVNARHMRHGSRPDF